LPCGHCFFPAPILHWLSHESHCCPVCRYAFDFQEKREPITTLTPNEAVNNYHYNYYSSANTTANEYFINASYLSPFAMMLSNNAINAFTVDYDADQMSSTSILSSSSPSSSPSSEDNV
jgi:hypothetical protein